MADHGARYEALPADQQQIKAAFRSLVKAFGGQDAVAEACGCRQQKISDFGNARLPDFPPVDLVAMLEASTVGLPGHPHVTRLLACRAGFVLVERSVGEDGTGRNLMHGLAQIGAELGDVSRCLSEALADGEFSQAERRQALEELAHVEARVAQLRVMIGEDA